MKKKLSINNCMNRIPDKETASLRIWTPKKDEVNYDDERGFEIDIGKKTKFKCLGFTKVSNIKTKELLFAYKFKHENHFILYYVPKETEQTKKMLIILKILANNIGYGLQDMKETLKEVKKELEEIKK